MENLLNNLTAGEKVQLLGKIITGATSPVKLFVALSHTLTQSQIDGFKNQYGVKSHFKVLPDGMWEHCAANDDNSVACVAAEIVTLEEEAPELQAQMSNIPATATLGEIQKLAKAIVAEAIKVGATHFYCVGEPTLTMWANLYSSQTVPFYGLDWNTGFEELVCIQSTTERRSVDVHNPDGSVTKSAVFQHVQWREMF
jgi:hypothetical protein